MVLWEFQNSLCHAIWLIYHGDRLLFDWTDALARALSLAYDGRPLRDWLWGLYVLRSDCSRNNQRKHRDRTREALQKVLRGRLHWWPVERESQLGLPENGWTFDGQSSCLTEYRSLYWFCVRTHHRWKARWQFWLHNGGKHYESLCPHGVRCQLLLRYPTRPCLLEEEVGPRELWLDCSSLEGWSRGSS